MSFYFRCHDTSVSVHCLKRLKENDHVLRCVTVSGVRTLILLTSVCIVTKMTDDTYQCVPATCLRRTTFGHNTHTSACTAHMSVLYLYCYYLLPGWRWAAAAWTLGCYSAVSSLLGTECKRSAWVAASAPCEWNVSRKKFLRILWRCSSCSSVLHVM